MSSSFWQVTAADSCHPVPDRPILFGLFCLSQACAGDLGIAVSLAAEGKLLTSRLARDLAHYGNAQEVRSDENVFTPADPNQKAKIIDRSLADLKYIRQLPQEVQTTILLALQWSAEGAFGRSSTSLRCT